MKHRITHILVECPELIASVRVGVLDVLAPLEKRSVCEVRFRETRNVQKEDLAWCDILVCVRGSETLTACVVQEAKRLGRMVLYFLDDDLLHLPPESLAYQYFEYGDHQKALRDILAVSDGLWGVNTLIRDDYLSLCGTDRWICTRMPVQNETCLPAQETMPIQVLYAGSVDHQCLIRELLAPAVRLVTEQCGDLAEFTFIGPDPELNDCPQVRHMPFFEDYDQYRSYVLQGKFQIGLAPTNMGRFFQSKYYNKFVEYTAIGATGIYTDCSLYNQVVYHEENGVLCENTPQSWAEAIVRLIQQPELRSRCFQNAANLLQSEFQEDRVAMQLLSQVPEIESFRGQEVSAKQVRIGNPLIAFYWERIRYLFQTYHILAVPIIAWKAVKKLVKWIVKK